MSLTCCSVIMLCVGGIFAYIGSPNNCLETICHGCQSKKILLYTVLAAILSFVKSQETGF